MRRSDKKTSRIALVTGASSGIGQASAVALASAGFVVYGTSRRVRSKNSRSAVRMIPLDVRDDDSVAACVKQVLGNAGRIDVLVNNAGIAIEGAVEETSLEEIRAVLETNFFGAVRMIRAVLPAMREQGRGRIVNVGSIAGFLPLPYSAAYCASKHALRGLAESLDHEVRSLGIRVSVVEPGFIRTDIVEHSSVAAAQIEPYATARAKPAQRFKKHIAQGADPAVVARTVVEAATAAKPQLHYLPDSTAQTLSLFRAVLPSSWFDYAFRRQVELD
jgi:NAD(P)-dependent dehydrogenase (short-subunit alcohol dehydrogenase family)